ncbi:hypothetical protein FAF44_02960 [Nonomuraea sp. MG754425]|uniref:hypothetical protein n=1 Tax=Nonomuraea sp. MG754425 TaxID=2570319 RepID=UPI001F460F9C|nr:hypothetical protein [Nonomuraea sp. MG754425]MCF6467375.1 hypothetical protein [Nonomuraea sp. MG754425]
MPKNAPSGPPDKPDNRATLTVAIPADVLQTFIRTLPWLIALTAVIILALNGFDLTDLAPMVLAPWAQRL